MHVQDRRSTLTVSPTGSLTRSLTPALVAALAALAFATAASAQRPRDDDGIVWLRSLVNRGADVVVARPMTGRQMQSMALLRKGGPRTTGGLPRAGLTLDYRQPRPMLGQTFLRYGGRVIMGSQNTFREVEDHGRRYGSHVTLVTHGFAPNQLRYLTQFGVIFQIDGYQGGHGERRSNSRRIASRHGHTDADDDLGGPEDVTDSNEDGPERFDLSFLEIAEYLRLGGGIDASRPFTREQEAKLLSYGEKVTLDYRIRRAIPADRWLAQGGRIRVGWPLSYDTILGLAQRGGDQVTVVVAGMRRSQIDGLASLQVVLDFVDRRPDSGTPAGPATGGDHDPTRRARGKHPTEGR